MVPFYLEPFYFSKDCSIVAINGYDSFVLGFVFSSSFIITTFFPISPFAIADRQIDDS